MPGSLRRRLRNLCLRSRSESTPTAPFNTTGIPTPSDSVQVSPPLSAPVGSLPTPVNPPLSAPAGTPISIPESLPASGPTSPPTSTPAGLSNSPTTSPLPASPPTSPLRPSSATYHPGSTPRAVLCRHTVPAPIPPSTTLPPTCPTCTLLTHVHTSHRSWRTARGVYGSNHHRTREARAAYHRAKCAHANHLAAQSSPARAARPRVSFAADVADAEGARLRRQFCRSRREYAPGRWAGELLDTSGSGVPAELFYAEPEARRGGG